MSERALGHLRGTKQNFHSTLVGAGLIEITPAEQQPRIVVTPDGMKIVGSTGRAPEGAYIGYLNNTSDEARRAAISELSTMAIRILTVESFEALVHDTNEVEMFRFLQQESWYEFARQIRNVFAHGGRAFAFSDHVKANILPVEWNGKVIDESLEGWVPDGDFWDWYDALELWDQFAQWAKTLPEPAT